MLDVERRDFGVFDVHGNRVWPLLVDDVLAVTLELVAPQSRAIVVVMLSLGEARIDKAEYAGKGEAGSQKTSCEVHFDSPCRA